MSDEETYTPPETAEGAEKPPTALGIPEKQPRDLGVHKIVFNDRGKPENVTGENAKAKEGFAGSITIGE